MLPTKQYFYLSALVPASKLHPIMQLLAKSSAYNVECRAYDQGEETKSEPKAGSRRDLEAVKQKVIDLLAKKGTMATRELAEITGEKMHSMHGILGRMVQAKLIKRGTKKGTYKS